MEPLKLFTLISHLFLVMVLGWYLITNLQWYHYRFERVIFRHKRYLWHLLYFVIPIFAYYLMGIYFWIYFYLGLLPALYLWHKKLDKPLVLTARVKRFFLFLFLAALSGDLLCFASGKCQIYGLFLPLFVALGASYLFEKILFLGYKKEATRKLESIPDLKILAITASYGKTSIKNFVYQIVKDFIPAYKTPRSVNTLGGLIRDVNEALPTDTRLYIAEAGARERGDIAEIAHFLNHHYAIVGKIGPQHIEYFKTLENIRNTKMEILDSKRLIKAFIHKSANVKPDERVVVYGENIRNIKATLDGLDFELLLDGKSYPFHAPLLGGFNAENIAAAILFAREIGMEMEAIQKAVSQLQPVEHRLQKIEAGGKVIIDDSFNGNLEGMLASYDLVSRYPGRKVIVTPGVLESDEESNRQLAEKIDEVFDLVIITGKVNAKTLAEKIKKPPKTILHDKSELEAILAEKTHPGDLILFSNDAPTFL
ncbi:MAG: UDP-N-acetylmuramoylalanyl-D-glutamyl-2, 6-diaminopimelate--D-alanyl-D-alanine ligase [Campylobacteraceae bacterium 4484_4]|nr:MAG: UDP-N-acetylmuramoylalanyl-D-glutamyl-2, 6-diaminopimelate--D-alanyl-D-alanine ligase [Campylobacteraceae bacterium 4484_4]